MLDTDRLAQLEDSADALIAAFDLHAPPIPIETMLRNPREGMWSEIDINRLSGTFMAVRDQYSPRMSLARMLARHAAFCPWGEARGLREIFTQDEEYLRAFARMIVLPREMIATLTGSARSIGAISHEFEAPEEDVRQRLLELNQTAG